MRSITRAQLTESHLRGTRLAGIGCYRSASPHFRAFAQSRYVPVDRVLEELGDERSRALERDRLVLPCRLLLGHVAGRQ